MRLRVRPEVLMTWVGKRSILFFIHRFLGAHSSGVMKTKYTEPTLRGEILKEYIRVC